MSQPSPGIFNQTYYRRRPLISRSLPQPLTRPIRSTPILQAHICPDTVHPRHPSKPRHRKIIEFSPCFIHVEIVIVFASHAGCGEEGRCVAGVDQRLDGIRGGCRLNGYDDIRCSMLAMNSKSGCFRQDRIKPEA